jgi:NADP-dependent 3-hydroxy acid dehydrogenase YdfG
MDDFSNSLLVDQTTQRFGHVYIVVNNTGIIQVGLVSTTTVEDFVPALDVMFWGALYPTLVVLPQMRAQRSGYVVNSTSIDDMVNVPRLFHIHMSSSPSSDF